MGRIPMPNALAYLIFFSTPLVAWAFSRRLPVGQAVAVTIIWGYLFLPSRVAFDFPLLPSFNKFLVPSLSAMLIGAMAVKAISTGHRSLSGPRNVSSKGFSVLEGWVPKTALMRVLLILLFIGTFMTVLSNRDTLFYGGTRLPGLRVYDMFSNALNMLVVLLPFFLGRKYLASSKSHLLLGGALFVMALIYSLPTLYEVRMSPQVNRIFYGYFPSAWIQHLRGGGFRPLVFLPHGLQLGIFLTVTIIVTAGLMRMAEGKRKIWYIFGLVWLFCTLFLAKTFGAFLIAVVVLPIALLLGARLQLRIAAILAICILAFPVLRGAGWVPVDAIVENIQKIDQQRANSLRFRLENEDILLAKANERPLFGWGGWSRNRVFDEDGNDISTTDGAWLIHLGFGGWVRYITQYGLLGLPIILLSFGKVGREVGLGTSTLALALTANLVDLIPNAGLTPVTWLIAGALLGRLEVGAKDTEREDSLDPIIAPKKLPYARDHGKKHPAHGMSS